MAQICCHPISLGGVGISISFYCNCFALVTQYGIQCWLAMIIRLYSTKRPTSEMESNRTKHFKIGQMFFPIFSRQWYDCSVLEGQGCQWESKRDKDFWSLNFKTKMSRCTLNWSITNYSPKQSRQAGSEIHRYSFSVRFSFTNYIVNSRETVVTWRSTWARRQSLNNMMSFDKVDKAFLQLPLRRIKR